MTPQIEGIKGRVIETPKGGWAANTWYVAEVASGKNNVFHKTLVFSGDQGTAKSARIINPSYDNVVDTLADRFVVRNIEKLGKLADFKASNDVEMKERAYYVASIKRGDDKPVIGLVFTGFLNGGNNTPGGYSFVYVEGENSAGEYQDCEVTLLRLIMTEATLDDEDEDEDRED